MMPTIFFTIGCLIYLARRLKLAPMHASRLGISGDTPFAHECCKSTKLWPINGHIFMFWAMSWLQVVIFYYVTLCVRHSANIYTSAIIYPTNGELMSYP